MHLKSKWLKIRTIHYSFIFSSKYRSRVFLPKWLTFLARKNRDGSKFESFCLKFNFYTDFEPSWLSNPSFMTKDDGRHDLVAIKI